MELPNGNILANDDLNLHPHHRDRQGDEENPVAVRRQGRLWLEPRLSVHPLSRPGHHQGELILDPFRRRVSSLATIAMGVGIAALLCVHAVASSPAPLKVGAVTRHAAGFLGRHVLLGGYLLARETGYILFSDEPSGRISPYDLPVLGPGIDRMLPMKKILIEGTFLHRDVAASNGKSLLPRAQRASARGADR